MTVRIATPRLSAEIDPQGAQLWALSDGEGRDLLWDGDPAIWKGRAPILFPIIGALAEGQYRLEDATYCLPRHGFARDRLFQVVEASASSASFRLEADDATRAVYPFDFALTLHFAIRDAALTIAATIENREAARDLPASLGFHPAFRWPLPYGRPRDAHRIRFERAEPAPVRRLDAAGLLLPRGFPTPIAGDTLTLRDDLFTDDALILDRVASRRVWYGAADGPQIEVAFPDTPYLGLWSKPGAGFVCIEPWHGHADPQGPPGELTKKPGIVLVPPGGSKTCTMTVALV